MGFGAGLSAGPRLSQHFSQGQGGGPSELHTHLGWGSHLCMVPAVGPPIPGQGQLGEG